MTWAERIYRLFLRAYPAWYRDEFAEPMARCFRDQSRAATNKHRPHAFCASAVSAEGPAAFPPGYAGVRILHCKFEPLRSAQV